jgi:chromate transport protein ChrA
MDAGRLLGRLGHNNRRGAKNLTLAAILIVEFLLLLVNITNALTLGIRAFVGCVGERLFDRLRSRSPERLTLFEFFRPGLSLF